MTILKSKFRIPIITEEETGYPIRQKVGRPHRMHRSPKNRHDKRNSSKSIKYLREKGKI